MNRSSDAGAGRPRRWGLWALALFITLVALVYQRTVGPTRPLRGKAEVGGETIRYKLKRSAGGTGAYDLAIRVAGDSLSGRIQHRRYRIEEPWQDVPLRLAPAKRGGSALTGAIPRQPSGGKVVYRVYLRRGSGEEVAIPAAGPLVLRFRGHVPLGILAPHVALMFLGMLWSNRAGLEALRRDGDPARLAQWSLLLVGVGGMILGPLVQWNAFGEAWTGIPFGWDLTDNKTLIAFVGWLLAFGAIRRHGGPTHARAVRYWVLGAALLTLIIFSIPHSVMGTELDYATGKRMIVP